MPNLVYSADRDPNPWSGVSDLDLLRDVQRGDEAALGQLIERKTNPLIQAVYRMLGDLEESRDVVQMAFVKIWEHRDRFDERWSPNTWMFRIATNLAIDQLRSRRARDKNVEPVRRHLRQVADTRTLRERASLHGKEVAGIFHELAAELTDKQRAVFLLRELEGRSSQEVAQIVGCRESTVRNHLFNARKVLRRELVRRYPEYAAASREARQEVAESWGGAP